MRLRMGQTLLPSTLPGQVGNQSRRPILRLLRDHFWSGSTMKQTMCNQAGLRNWNLETLTAPPPGPRHQSGIPPNGTFLTPAPCCLIQNNNTCRWEPHPHLSHTETPPGILWRGPPHSPVVRSCCLRVSQSGPELRQFSEEDLQCEIGTPAPVPHLGISRGDFRPLLRPLGSVPS